MGENVSHIEESLHNAKAFLRSLTSPDDDIANAVIVEIDKAMFESLPALARQAEALQRENAELREALRPFADVARYFGHLGDDNGSVMVNIYLGSLRRARALLGGENEGN